MLLNVDEMESLMIWLAATYPAICRRIRLPKQTYEGRTVHAIQIGRKASAPGAMIIGGVHAREWGGPDICLQFATDLLEAYTKKKGLAYEDPTSGLAGTSFDAITLRRLVDTTTIVVLPCVNPDGYAFDLANPTVLWRKNRNPKYYDGKTATTVGADINRNYAFLWDFRKQFHPATTPAPASDDRASNDYHGDAPFSENESQNVKWLMDEHESLRRFLDLHSYAGTVLYSWGHDDNQSSDPKQRFDNASFDGKRGLQDTTYREYIDASDWLDVEGIANRVASAMSGVRAKPYDARQSVKLGGNWYPTSGASDDYAFSRHVSDPGSAKVFGFTLEFNFIKEGFHGTGDEKVLTATKRDVIPGLIEFCLSVMPAIRRRPRPGARIQTRLGANANGLYVEASGIVVRLPNGKEIALPPIRVNIFGPDGGIRPPAPGARIQSRSSRRAR